MSAVRAVRPRVAAALLAAAVAAAVPVRAQPAAQSAAQPPGQTAAQADARLEQARQAMAAGRFADAAPLFLSVLAVDPSHVEALSGAVDALEATGSWREALPYLDRLVGLRPYDGARLAQYGEMLSWSSSTRARSRELLERALDLDRSNVRARVALANLDAWSGRTGAALDGFAAVLASDPANVAALRGLAEVRVWNEEFQTARDLALRALALDPRNPYVRLTLARADVGLGRYDEALEVLGGMANGPSYDEFEQIAGNARRGSSRWVEAGLFWRDDRRGLSLERPTAAVSAPLGPRGRATAWFSPAFFSGPQGDFHSQRVGGAFDTRNDSWRVHVEGDGEHYGSDVPTAVDGAIDVAYRGRGPVTFAAGARREAVEDTRVSTSGIDLAGVTVGQVRSNLAYASVGYSDARQHVDAAFRVGGGAYTGRGLDANRRWSVGGGVGVTLNGDRPYVRIGYAVDYLSFGFDASALPWAPGQRRSGGYFSPTRFLTNVATGRVAWRLARDLGEWFAEGSVGSQNVETSTQRFGDMQCAGTFATGIVWHPGPNDELRAEYRYLNVFDAWRRHAAAVAYRRYF
jgi:tetratricopeptide (TPR) repeat protein